MPETSELIILPHFKSEEVEALRVEHEHREASAKVRPALNPDDERVRDGIQRANFWGNQILHLREADLLDEIALAHAEEELAHALFVQGRIDDALSLAKDPERRAYYQSIGFAILKDDNAFCDCPESEDVVIDGKAGRSQFWHQTGSYPSAKHDGKMTPIWKCAKCGFTNITPEG